MPQLRSRRCRARLLARRRPRDPVRQPRRRGSVVKAAGVDDSILTFSRPAVVAESQEEAVDAILHDGDTVSIDIPNRRLTLEVAEAELAERRDALESGGGYAPKLRIASPTLRAYAAMATSADTGAIRDVNAVERAVAAAAQSREPSELTAMTARRNVELSGFDREHERIDRLRDQLGIADERLCAAGYAQPLARTPSPRPG